MLALGLRLVMGMREEGEEGEGILLLRGGGGAAREAEGPGDEFGVLCLYERHEGKVYAGCCIFLNVNNY